jgi:hypothetical protein
MMRLKERDEVRNVIKEGQVNKTIDKNRRDPRPTPREGQV